MILESWLAFFHISAILAWIVFATSQAALCRSDWMNVATLQRLARMDRILWVATAAVLLSGLARIWWGNKGLDFYAGNLLLYSKIALFAVVASLQVGPSRQYRSWMAELQQTQELPADGRVRAARRNVMIATHLMALIPLPAVFLARGFGG
ncbi:MAG: DUF2214 family protein [Ottowia sp.]|nr:DUF2214 family protein [Ottowia sp.]